MVKLSVPLGLESGTAEPSSERSIGLDAGGVMNATRARARARAEIGRTARPRMDASMVGGGLSSSVGSTGLRRRVACCQVCVCVCLSSRFG